MEQIKSLLSITLIIDLPKVKEYTNIDNELYNLHLEAVILLRKEEEIYKSIYPWPRRLPAPIKGSSIAHKESCFAQHAGIENQAAEGLSHLRLDEICRSLLEDEIQEMSIFEK